MDTVKICQEFFSIFICQAQRCLETAKDFCSPLALTTAISKLS